MLTLSCTGGTNQRCQGTAANLGTHSSGIPLGWLVDEKGPRPGTVIAAVALFAGYFPIHRGQYVPTLSMVLN